MSIDTLSELLNQIILYTSLLCGFSLAAVLQLISLENQKGKVFFWTTASFIVSTGMLLFATWVAITFSSTINLAGGDLDWSRPILIRSFVMTTFGAAIGTIAFMVGLGLVGWLHSSRMGYLSTGLVLLLLVLMFFTYMSLASVAR